MDQLVADEAAASGGDPVDETATAQQEAVEETSLAEDMYPDDATQPSEDGEGEPEVDDRPAIDAPHSWKAEDKAKWGELPRDVQEIVARRETEVAQLITRKSEEAKTAREQAKSEVTQQAVQELVEYHRRNAGQLQALQALILPQEPDRRLMFSQSLEDRHLYQQQKLIYDDALAQYHQVQQAIEHDLGRAQQIEGQRSQEERAREEADNRAVLMDKFPEWLAEDGSADKLKQELKSVWAAYYPRAAETDPAMFDSANADDLLALREIAKDRADAQRWRSYERNRTRDQQGRFKPQRALPPVTRPGSTTRPGAMSNQPVEKLLYPND